MTESTPSSETPEEPQREELENSPESEAGSAWTASGDDLPELEELTPELVEEEAIRGDFMLRGAAILLAVLFGFAQIADSEVLVHIRSGDQMRSGGMLPPRSDVFSFANEGQAAPNVSWLFDHIISLVWMVGGPMGLTLFKAATAGLIAWILSRISVPGLPTWWSSVCGVIALAACASDLMPITDLMTLLGLVILLRLLHRAYNGQYDGLVWKAALLTAVWGNLDPHAWLSVVALLLFSVGAAFAMTPGETRETVPPGTLWAATALSAVALLINPFPVASALSIVQTYFVEYPGLRALYPLRPETIPLLDGRVEYYPLFNVEAWDGFEFSFIAALMVIFCAGMSIAVARDHRETPWALLLAGFSILAILSIHELAAAALVAAAVAGTVGQRWYQRTFPQEYTTKPSEVLFSRAGRAVTVMGFALVGFLVVTDRLPTRTAVGTGFSDDFGTTITTLETQLSQLPEDARVLHTRPDFGDYLIWSGRRSFVDSRISAFGVEGDPESVLQQYLTMRNDLVVAGSHAGRMLYQEQLRAAGADAAGADAAGTDAAGADAAGADEAGGVPDAAAEEANAEQIAASLHESLRAMGITHAAAGLYPPEAPHHRTMGVLAADSISWAFTDLDASAAVFAYVRDVPEEDRPEQYSVAEAAFEHVEPENVQRFEFARAKGIYDKYLYRERPDVPEELRVVRNQLAMPPSGASLMIALRAVNRLLARDEQNAEAFLMQAMVYSRLAEWEAQTAAQTGGLHAGDMRYMQTLMAARQAVTIEPESGQAWNLLYQLYAQRGRADQALECMENAIPFMERSVRAAPGGNQRQMLEQLQTAQRQLAAAVSELQNRRDQMLQQDPQEDPVQRILQKHAIAEQIASMGHIGAALEILQENQSRLQEAPQIFARAETLRGQLLLETGALQEAFEVFLELDAIARKEAEGRPMVFPWTTMSFFSKLGLANYPDADKEMGTNVMVLRAQSTNDAVLSRSMQSLPLSVPITPTPEALSGHWPYPHLVSYTVPIVSRQNEILPRFLQAMAELEGGNIEAARVNLQALATEYGQNQYRPLAGAYLSLIRDDFLEYFDENSLSVWEEWPEEDFAEVVTSSTEESSTEESSTEESSTEESSS